MLLVKQNQSQIEVEDQIYDVILTALKEQTKIHNSWLNYTGIFPNIKPMIQTELGAAVWYVSAVLEHLAVTSCFVSLKNETGETMYYIDSELMNE